MLYNHVISLVFVTFFPFEHNSISSCTILILFSSPPIKMLLRNFGEINILDNFWPKNLHFHQAIPLRTKPGPFSLLVGDLIKVRMLGTVVPTALQTIRKTLQGQGSTCTLSWTKGKISSIRTQPKEPLTIQRTKQRLQNGKLGMLKIMKMQLF